MFLLPKNWFLGYLFIDRQSRTFSKRQSRITSPLVARFPFPVNFLSILFPFFLSSFASLFLNHFLRPKFFYNAHHPFSSLSFLFFLTISHHSGVFMRSCEVTEDIKRVSSSFFFFPSFPRNTGIYIGRKSDSN